MFEDSVLIVAHPDDDILWMGSVVEKVDSIIFCFNDDPGNAELGAVRKKTIAEYPLSNVTTLDIAEPQSWDKADWSQPVTTEYGIRLNNCRESDEKYMNAYYKLIHILRERVANRKNVFTHNPWGEYGHEEHVLVYRVLKTLQAEFRYDIWFSNYCSNRSVHLMNRYISGFVAEYECLPVNLTLVHEIAEIYRSNECWTWYEDYQWFEQECLMREVPSSEKSELELLPYGHNFPVNYIKIHIESQKSKSFNRMEIAARLKRKLKRVFHKAGYKYSVAS